MSHVWLLSGLLGLYIALSVWRIKYALDRNPNAELLALCYQQAGLSVSNGDQLENLDAPS